MSEYVSISKSDKNASTSPNGYTGPWPYDLKIDVAGGKFLSAEDVCNKMIFFLETVISTHLDPEVLRGRFVRAQKPAVIPKQMATAGNASVSGGPNS